MPWGWNQFEPKLSVAEQRKRAEKRAAKSAKEGARPQPVCIEGRKIANTFWGKAWCDNLESYSDYASRLPRGRSYVRNGCVIDLRIEECCVEAQVSGTEVYDVSIAIEPVKPAIWSSLKAECAGQIGSLIDLLQGKLAGPVMEIMTRRGSGLFPQPSEMKFRCSCPDYANLCKHVAAVLYGIGARLDRQPELLFLLRKAKQDELITEAAGSIAAAETGGGTSDVLAEGDLASVFGIDIELADDGESAKVAEVPPDRTVMRKDAEKPAAGAPKRAGKKSPVKSARASGRTKKTPAAARKRVPRKSKPEQRK